jgi:RNA polymerase sigma factor (TIGR02999 family)
MERRGIAAKAVSSNHEGRPTRSQVVSKADVTTLLVAWTNGDEAAGAPLMEAVYDELRRMARVYLRRERKDHSLSGTALVHEAYVKLVDQRRARWQSRAHFFAVAARVMRRLLVDHARARDAQKRGRSFLTSEFGADVAVDPRGIDLLALDRALDKLTALDERKAKLVELRFFGGLTVEETGEVLAIAPITVKRDWALARTWLYRELQREAS